MRGVPPARLRLRHRHALRRPRGADPRAHPAALLNGLERRFDDALVAAGPFEPAPRLAVGVSGGPDSLALALLASAWAASRGGSAVALVVDHGVRPASGLEAALAERWLVASGLEVGLLRLGAGCGRSAQALRGARLLALAEAAREAGALHLLLGQHALDQAETVLIRHGRGSGPDGLAAMAPVRPSGPVRILRPLLSAAPGELRAWLRRRGQPWIEDPSNASVGLRARLRAGRADRDGVGAATLALCAVARRAAEGRRRREADRDEALAEGVSLFPLGHARLDGAAWSSWPEPLARRALAALLRAVGGGEQPVREERLEGLTAALRAGR
ncbi:MAG: tRNA lysidine(34) synthetase TilS, partial [Acetobacteraceae bacterium]